MTTMTETRLDDVRKVLYAINRLREISRRLNGIGCRKCNGYQSETQEKRDQTIEERLLNEAQELAAGLGVRFYHQGDPRGCAVYLIDESMDGSTYNRGIALY